MIKQPEGASPALIYDHGYVPRRLERADWDLCLVCNLGCAAHARIASAEEAEALRAPSYVIQSYGGVHSWTREPVRRWSFMSIIRGLLG